jgi:hypothetical protein
MNQAAASVPLAALNATIVVKAGEWHYFNFCA